MRWLWAACLLLSARAWRPPASPVDVTPQSLRRSSRGNTHYLHLHGWHLKLQENRAIRSPYYTDCKFYKGRVLYEEDSTATVTECDGQLYGLVQVGNEDFVLQPTRANGHVLHRRDVLLAEQPAAYNLTGDTVTDLDISLEDDIDISRPHVRARHSSHADADVDYFRSIVPISRPVSGVHGLWLEMAIVADHTMLKFHGRERVKHYILALMNIVSAIFNDPSLSSNMTLVINKLYLYEEKDPVIRYGNVKKSLEAVNKWNYRHLMKLPTENTGWDAAVWLTRQELGGPSGFAPVGGVCSKLRSAAIDRDEGLTSAFVIAHELAHLLGLTHDGEDQCSTEAQHGSVMAPTVLATLHNFAWSKCSKEQFHEKSKKWWCLHERSRDEGVELGGTKELSNYVFTMEEQCRTEFGEGYSVCKSVKVRSACSRLWCAHRAMPLVCRSKRAPPLEGTPCGHNRWCVDRVCESMPGHDEENRVEVEAPPQWEEWSQWSTCSADCGYGLRKRKRLCRYKGIRIDYNTRFVGGAHPWCSRCSAPPRGPRPPPASDTNKHGCLSGINACSYLSISETACEGAGLQVNTCWSGICAATRDARAEFCARRSRRLIPHIHANETKHCEGWCMDYAGGEPTSHGNLPDGTPCSYDRQYDVCFEGTCVRGQCNSSDPTCNWCPDEYCNNNTHYYTRQLGKGWTRMAVIPHEAHKLSIHILTPLALQIAVRERKRERPILELSKHSKRFEIEQNNYLKYDPYVPQNLQIVEVDSNVIDIKEEERYGWEGEVVTAGTLLHWKQTDSDVFITANSRLQTDLMIMAIPEHPMITDEAIPVEVSVNYSTPTGHTRPLEYRWSTERGPCSVTCGGGMRLVRPRCPRDQRCSPPRYERCNTHSCEFVWKGGEWEECSATCGSAGVQERQLYCVPANSSTSSQRELIRSTVSPALCPTTKPVQEQPCNRIPCPVYWEEMPWTPCSTTCGRGVSYRPLRCPASEEMLCGPKPRERRRRCRLRRCPPAARPSPPCPPTDPGEYCELFPYDQLQRNCVVPPFRRYCCNACKHADLIEHQGAG